MLTESILGDVLSAGHIRPNSLSFIHFIRSYTCPGLGANDIYDPAGNSIHPNLID